MKLSQFKFQLPENLIAQEPPLERDQCRMMVVDRKTGAIEHHKFTDILEMYDDGDVMIEFKRK